MKQSHRAADSEIPEDLIWIIRGVVKKEMVE